MKNRGIDLAREVAEQSEQDWVFGAASAPCLSQIPADGRQQFLPDGELQFGVNDFMDCASRGPINILEAKFTWLYTNDKLKNRKWLEDNGYVQNGRVLFSDRFVAIKSGTTQQGNSLKAPLDAIYRHGLIPKKMLPKPEGATFEQYHTGVTPEMEALGTEFAARFVINYEKVTEADFAKADDFLDVAVFAWPTPVAGIYPRMEMDPNHVVAIIRPEYFVFDNYLDGDGDYIKQLSPNYDFWQYGYRVFISREVTVAELQEKITWLTALVAALRDLWQIFNRANVDVPAPELPMNAPEQPQDKPDYISLMAEAIKSFEGWNPGSASFRRNNPGNVKGRDGQFLVFKTPEAGMDYLKDYIHRACTGKHAAYKPQMMIYNPAYVSAAKTPKELPGFIQVYAPDPEPIPKNYANHICQKMHIFPSKKLSELV